MASILNKTKIFICTNGNCTETNQAQAVAAAIEAWIKANDFDRWDAEREIRCIPCGCLDVCRNGAVIRIFPENITYWDISLDTVEEVLNQHFHQQKIVSAHLAERKQHG